MLHGHDGTWLLQVRKQAAEQLYVRLMTIEDSGVYSEDCLELAYDVLTEVAWDGPLENVKAAQSQLLNIFELQASECDAVGAAMQVPNTSNRNRTDENASYQALINDGSRL